MPRTDRTILIVGAVVVLVLVVGAFVVPGAPLIKLVSGISSGR